MGFFRKIMDAKTALNAVSDELNPVELANVQEVIFYYVATGTIATGAVQPETSAFSAIERGPDNAAPYTGAWSPEGAAPVTLVTDATRHTQISGPTMWRRVRITTGLTGGGTVSIYALGR